MCSRDNEDCVASRGKSSSSDEGQLSSSEEEEAKTAMEEGGAKRVEKGGGQVGRTCEGVAGSALKERGNQARERWLGGGKRKQQGR